MNARRMILINIIILVILVGGGFTGYYFYNRSVSYVTTDNAYIDGQSVTIASPATGKLVSWDGKEGKSFTKGDKVGTVEVQNGANTVKMDIKAPADGTIVKNFAVANTYVAAGTTLAQSYDLDSLFVTAEVKETDLNDVKTGQDVDVYVDAYPNTRLTGTVDSIGKATASTFSLMPTDRSSGNYTKETQVIPVRGNCDVTDSL
ncbi:efflux RND transporter periplasmic adaptor subunit [Heyndrickxia coagulans]|uniref:efflux RND transporter periplasmic adaptor subunit n=1 Tax=Heyndrickxia coagulans TaxID=1398 RepID=UPI00214D1FB5|nr:efflux RND transporter periplasmic adaptor subunit [Heyndrickxia coagulans]MCR2846752.1 efflux RND transporter periplasmic adaptor subunit [Heyndrickxia coagulans]